MNSPFPGMDPFLESHWRDVHTSMMTYMMSVHSRTRTAVFGASLRETLPVIPIPLRPHDSDAQLNIQEIVELVYDRGRYWKLNYQLDPEPPFAPDEAVWVHSLLRASSRRQ